ncbi:MAG: methylenetetrahydrofolate reductase [NAD(P)H] [Planctomycetota bacterium]
MPLSSVYHTGRVGLSFELFPPKTAELEVALWDHVEKLSEFRPDYFTCTYGAGGSTRDKTLEIVAQVKRRFNVSVASHLTCVGTTVDQLRDYLTAAQTAAVDYIVALRGDPPRGQTEFQAVDGGLRYANELVSLIRAEFPEFGIAVAGYPEVHQEAPSAEVDLENLRRKVDAGAHIIVTQLFYDNADFFRFRDRCEQAGIRVPIVPGLLPVTNLAQVQRIASLCKARLPANFVSALSQHEDADWQFQCGVEFATKQLSDLLQRGVPGVHFYVLNKSSATAQVLQAAWPHSPS